MPGPGLQVATGQPFGQAAPGRPILHRGDRHHPVGEAAAVGQVEVPEEPGVGSLGQGGQPTAAVGILEVGGALAHHLVNFVNEEHRPPLDPTSPFRLVRWWTRRSEP